MFLHALHNLLGPHLAAHLLLRHILDQLTDLCGAAHALLFPVGLVALVQGEGRGGEAGQLLARGLQLAAAQPGMEHTLDLALR